MTARLDLSDWVIHFVHGRDPDLDPRMVLSTEDELAPGLFHVDPKVNKHFSDWDMFDSEYPLEPDAGAYAVLKKLLSDGHVRCGWSFRAARGREPRATIYGPRAAACFTEMPLFALMDYARVRADKTKVATYGIAVRRAEFLAAGGRPAIYGLSSDHKEVGDHVWPRGRATVR